MYGVSEQLMQRMQKRMKEKIYREMIEEQQKYKKKYKERNKDKNLIQSRYKTQPNQQYQEEYQFNKYEHNPKPSFIHEESTFLPVINKRYSPSENETSDSRINPEYRNYINRRNKRIKQEQPHRKRTSASAIFQPQQKKKVEESQEEAEQYLSQCQQIINNLRMLNKRNQDKLKQRQSKKATQVLHKSSPKNKSFSANVYGETPEYRLNSFNSKRRDFNLKNTSLTDPYRNEQLSNNSFRVYSPFQEENPQNEFSEFSDLQTKPKERANALTISVNSKPNSVGMRSREVNMKEKSESLLKAQENFKRLSPIKREDECNEEEQEEVEEEKAAGYDKRSTAKDENKRQKAIVKYLKKARLRGNLLYQKIQSKKTQPSKSQPPNANPENPAINQNNANQVPNLDPNPPQNPLPNPDKSSSIPALKK